MTGEHEPVYYFPNGTESHLWQEEWCNRCVGHRVLFVVYVEAVSASMKVRTLQDVQDYGPAKDG